MTESEKLEVEIKAFNEYKEIVNLIDYGKGFEVTRTLEKSLKRALLDKHIVKFELLEQVISLKKQLVRSELKLAEAGIIS